MVLLATNTSSLDILGFKKIPYDTCLSFALGKKKTTEDGKQNSRHSLIHAKSRIIFSGVSKYLH